MQYSTIEPKDQIFVERYRFLSFAKNMDKNIDKNISVTFSSKYTQKTLTAKQSTTDTLKTVSKKAIQKTAENSKLFEWQ